MKKYFKPTIKVLALMPALPIAASPYIPEGEGTDDPDSLKGLQYQEANQNEYEDEF